MLRSFAEKRGLSLTLALSLWERGLPLGENMIERIWHGYITFSQGT